ncbi:MAG: hypothetical protein ACLU99_01900 [Alphaproteobacteria bacterium]
MSTGTSTNAGNRLYFRQNYRDFPYAILLSRPATGEVRNFGCGFERFGAVPEAV